MATKILILSTATGEGHNSASFAIKNSLIVKDCAVSVEDVLKNCKNDVSFRVSGLYSRITLHIPWFFGLLYSAGELVSSSRRKSPIYYLNALYAGRLYHRIQSEQPDVILCPHIFSAQAITYIKQKYRMTIPTVGLITDYTCSPFWEETNLDSYIIPAETLKPEFIRKGIPERKLISLGLPVNSRFERKTPKEEARKRFGFTAEHVFVVMGGSMGFGRMDTLVKALRCQCPEAQIAAVCGRNTKLFRRLSGIDRVFAYPFLSDIDVLMDAADVLLTKPGGLSCTEAAVKNIPIVFTRPIPGCEQRNIQFFCSMGMAEYSKSEKKAAEKACRLAADSLEADRMLKCQRQCISRKVDSSIADYLIMLGSRHANKEERHAG